MSIFINIRRGIIFGLTMACLLSLYVAVLSLVHNLDISARHGIPLTTLLVFYFVGSVLGGALVGLLLSLTRWWIGAMLVGFVALIPFFLAMHIYDHGLGNWDNLDSVVVVSLIIGAPLGLIARAIIRHVDPFGPIQ